MIGIRNLASMKGKLTVASCFSSHIQFQKKSCSSSFFSSIFLYVPHFPLFFLSHILCFKEKQHLSKKARNKRQQQGYLYSSPPLKSQRNNIVTEKRKKPPSKAYTYTQPNCKKETCNIFKVICSNY
uniref:Uncharacterized protein n=1 Tax=Cacopsylla melanoneura TaxID=428564 RepID=A0A8D8ZCD4_9HEMI